jgi:3-oxoadipate enol-lactonase
VGTCAAIRDTDFTTDVTKIKKPVLCVVGDQDMATSPDLVRELSELIPGARYEEIKNAGHIPCVEQPAALVRVLRDFCNSL